MGDRLVRKGLVLGIIFLFIGAGVYPAIAVKLNTTINTVQDEKSNVNAKKIEQLSDLPCNCKKNITTSLYGPPEICYILFMIFFWGWMNRNRLPYAGYLAGWALNLMYILNC